MNNKWTINNSKYADLPHVRQVNEFEGQTITLLTVNELHDLQQKHPNMLLLNIFGEIIKASDANDDERMGFVAYGILKNVK